MGNERSTGRKSRGGQRAAAVFWHEILGAFSPLPKPGDFEKRRFRFIIAFQVAVLLIVWATSTYVFSSETDGWCGGPWSDLLESRRTRPGTHRQFLVESAKPMAWATLISLGLAYLTVVPAFQPIAMAVSKGRFLGMVGAHVFLSLLFFPADTGLRVSLLVFGVAVFFCDQHDSTWWHRSRKKKFDLARTLRIGRVARRLGK